MWGAILKLGKEECLVQTKGLYINSFWVAKLLKSSNFLQPLKIGEPFAEQPLAVAVQEGSSLAKEISQV